MKRKPSILLVEDEENFGSVLKNYLELSNFRVTLCKNGKQGLHSFINNRFDLCILDVMMPQMDGFNLAIEIKKIAPKTPFIFLTAKKLKEDLLKGYQIGADDYITKPFDTEVLLCKLKAILNRNGMTMKKLLLISLLTCNAFVFAEEGSEEKVNAVTDTTKSVISSFVKFGKDLIEGADEGVNEGRKTGLSKDDALIIDNGEDLNKQLTLKLLSVKEAAENESYVVLGFKNANDRPVRVINLQESENIIVIDTDGYATNLTLGRNNPEDLTIPSKAGKKQQFHFNIAAAAVKEVRIMGNILSK